MKLLVVSDIHGSLEHLLDLKDIYIKEHPVRIIFLGDMYSYGASTTSDYDDLLNYFQNKIVLRGNCDTDLDVLTSNLFFVNYHIEKVNDKTIYFTHGNKYNINNQPSDDFDVLIQGHLHQSFIIKEDGKIFASPGSLSKPRGASTNSYMIIDDKGLHIKDINMDIIEECNL